MLGFRLSNFPLRSAGSWLPPRTHVSYPTTFAQFCFEYAYRVRAPRLPIGCQWVRKRPVLNPSWPECGTDQLHYGAHEGPVRPQLVRSVASGKRGHIAAGSLARSGISQLVRSLSQGKRWHIAVYFRCCNLAGPHRLSSGRARARVPSGWRAAL
jgi:hypothetical protein